VKNLIYILFLFLCSFAAFCYGDANTTTADGLTLTEILTKAGVVEPNEVTLSSDESIVTETLTILLEMLVSACSADPNGCNDGSNETVNAILDIIKKVLSIYNDTTMTTGESEPSEANLPTEPNDSQGPDVPDSLFKPRNEFPPLLLHCPDDSVRPYWLEEFSRCSTSEESLESLNFGTMSSVGLQEIIESIFLDPNIVYYIPDPPLLIHGEGVHVVIPSDTLIVVAEEWEYSIVVYDGAKIDLGEPAPVTGDPNFIYQQPDINPPVWIVGESGEPFFNNYCGILITRTASPECRLNNMYLEGFYHGALIDQQLEEPISNAYANGCYNGFFSFGSNRFISCYANYYGLWTPEYPYDGHGFLFDVYSMDMTLLTDNEFQIDYCLVNDGERGYTVYGATDPNSIPLFRCWDSAATNNFVAFNGWEGQVLFSIVRPGMWNNDWSTNFPELPLNKPHYAPENPIQYDPNDYRIYLVADANFVDAGSGLSPNPGWTTRKDGKPDEGIADSWPHYQSDMIELSADITADHEVDANDLVILTLNWLKETNDPVDITNDGLVNYFDFSWISRQWLKTELFLEFGYPEKDQSVDRKDISGYLALQLNQIPQDVWLVTIYVDNMRAGGWLRGWDKFDQWIGLETERYSNGWHTIRLSTISFYDGIINYEPINVYFNNMISKVSAGEFFHPDEDYTYGGFYNGNQILEAEVTDMVDGTVLWSDTVTGNYVNIVVPGYSFGDYKFCELTITETGGEEKSVGGSAVTKKDLTKKFKQAEYPAGVRMVIVLPNKDVYRVRKPAILECAEACNNRNVSWVPLYHHDVNVTNLTYLYQNSYVRYIYWCGHANNNVQGIPRTRTECWKYEKGGWWDIISNWHKIGVFSYTQQSVPDADSLPDDWDTRGFDLWTLGMYDSWNKKIVFVDGCLSATEPPDMAYAYGVFSLQGQGSLDQIYIGWRVKVLVSTGIMEQIVGNTTEGVRMFWERMGSGDDIYDALYYTSVHGGIGMRRAMWGDNGLLDIGDVGGDDKIFLWGNGLITQMKLDP